MVEKGLYGLRRCVGDRQGEESQSKRPWWLALEADNPDLDFI